MIPSIQKINKKDLNIIAHLRKDARMPLTAMSRKTKIPVSTLFDRITRNNQNIIQRHTTLINFYELGYATRANILIKVDKQDKQNLKEYLQKELCINSVFRINNGYDFMIEGIFKEIKDMEEFLEKLEGKFSIIETKSFFIIEDLKREAFLSQPELLC